MPLWIPTVAATVGVALVNAFRLFYFKFVPEVNDQKRHLKQAGWWAFDIATIIFPCWSLYAATQAKGPITPTLVTGTAISAVSLAFCLSMVSTRRTVGYVQNKSLDTLGQIINVQGRLVDMSLVHKEALRLLANDANLSLEYSAKLKALLGMEDPKTDTKQLGE